MRLRFGAILLAVVAAVGAFSVVQRRSASADEAEEQAKIERGLAVDANTALLDELPALDGVKFVSFTESESMTGGPGLDWQIVHSATSLEVAEDVVRRHAEVLASWPEFVDRSPTEVTATDGKRWVHVSGGPIGEDRRPGVIVRVNALDGGLRGTATRR